MEFNTKPLPKYRLVLLKTVNEAIYFHTFDGKRSMNVDITVNILRIIAKSLKPRRHCYFSV